MKSIKEKQLLVKWAKALNEEIDSTILKDVEEYEKLQAELKESLKQRPLSTDGVVILETKEELEENVAKQEKLEELKEQIIEKTDLITKSVEEITKSIVKEDSYQQPNPPLVDKNFEAVQKKLKFLEQAIGKIAATGPGSGEVRLKYLDDIDRSSIGENKHLAYNAATDTFFFETVTASEPQVKSNWTETDINSVAFILNKPALANVAISGDYADLSNTPTISSIVLIDDGYTTNIADNTISVINVPNDDIGPIDSLRYNITGYGANADVGPGLTYYDPDRDTLEILHKDGTATYVGLDNYIRVSNNGSGNVIPRGSLVQFVGVESANLVPYVDLFKADANAEPLYVVGLAASDLTPNTAGRAILLGEIEDIDTTGNAVGEVWQTGDILWASPSLPGGLTKFRPTAPNAVISVAAVLNADPTEGHLLVRPTIEFGKDYGRFARTTDLTTASINTAAPVTFNKTTISNGVYLSNANTSITVSQSGYYQISVSAQLDTNSNKGLAYLWLRRNGVNVEETTRREAIESSDDTRTFAYINDISLNAGDNVQIMFAVTSTDLRFDATAATAFAPATASFIVSLTQVQL